MPPPPAQPAAQAKAPIRVGTFCSGIAAPERAWSALGWQPQWFSEIDPFACAVLAHHYPGVPNLGDMEAIRGETLRGTVDVVCAGTPCQSFSVAGLRGGMADPRGNLALVFLRLVDAIRPAWVVWENVPGVLSSNGGRDFGSFLGGLGQLGYGFAYRVLDAQHFGVPQRRRRVFVVGCLGDWRGAAAVLFERHSLCGHPAPGRETREGVTRSVAPCFDASYASKQGASNQDLNHGCGHLIPVTHSLRADGFDASEDGTGRGTPNIPIDMRQASRGATMTNNRADDACSGGAPGTGIGEAGDPAPSVAQSHTPAVAYRDDRGRGNDRAIEGQAYPLHAAKGQSEQQVVAYSTKLHNTKSNQAGKFYEDYTAGLDRNSPPPAVAYTVFSHNGCAVERHAKETDTSAAVDSQGAYAAGQGGTVIAFQERGREGGRSCETSEDIAYSLNAPAGGGRRQENNIVAFAQNQRGELRESETAPQLTCGGGKPGEGFPAARAGMAVRRLTPRECERLQGFPDNYTLIPYRGKPAADGPRYRALGNSMAVPVLRWIGRRIAKVCA